MEEQYLTPLREGQQFQLCQKWTGVSVYGKPPYGGRFKLMQLQEITDGIVPGRLKTVQLGDILIVEDAWWGLSLNRQITGGWYVESLRPSDRMTFLFLQCVDDDLWRAQYPESGQPKGQVASVVTAVCHAAWPEPSPESLQWATNGLINEQVPGSGHAMMRIDNADLSKLPLEASLERALALLRKWRVPEPEAALRERGFQV